MSSANAIIADDEEHIRASIRQKLALAWPELTILGEAANGQEAIDLAAATRPRIAFLDIRMPGISGLEVARRIAGQCRIVFITAYDNHAVEAFERQAVDYLLKPVSDERLRQTVARLKKELGGEEDEREGLAAMRRLLAELGGESSRPTLNWLRVQHGDGIRLIATAEVWFFRAEDKYTTVVTGGGEWLIRKSIRELAEELDPDAFWRVHRGVIVNVKMIAEVRRSFNGGLTLLLADQRTTLPVSRAYAHLFRQM